jgi:hypothetical protein
LETFKSLAFFSVHLYGKSRVASRSMSRLLLLPDDTTGPDEPAVTRERKEGRRVATASDNETNPTYSDAPSVTLICASPILSFANPSFFVTLSLGQILGQFWNQFWTLAIIIFSSLCHNDVR